MELAAEAEGVDFAQSAVHTQHLTERAVGVARDPEAGGIQQRGHVLVAVGHVAVGVPRIGHTYRPDRRRIPAAT